MSTTETDYPEASKVELQKSVRSLWTIVCKFSERQDSSEDEIFRWMQARYRAALVAKKSGVMDSTTFDDESYRFAKMFADIGGDSVIQIKHH